MMNYTSNKSSKAVFNCNIAYFSKKIFFKNNCNIFLYYLEKIIQYLKYYPKIARFLSIFSKFCKSYHSVPINILIIKNKNTLKDFCFLSLAEPFGYLKTLVKLGLSFCLGLDFTMKSFAFASARQAKLFSYALASFRIAQRKSVGAGILEAGSKALGIGFKDKGYKGTASKKLEDDFSAVAGKKGISLSRKRS